MIRREFKGARASSKGKSVQKGVEKADLETDHNRYTCGTRTYTGLSVEVAALRAMRDLPSKETLLVLTDVEGNEHRFYVNELKGLNQVRDKCRKEARDSRRQKRHAQRTCYESD
mmetsp:Transcript_64807/g.141225  ORF Transcript_64807/g.141225 Transcript_64807/m.141225 type:complete len:114 (-) Transcript_64807:3221-3562(-)